MNKTPDEIYKENMRVLNEINAAIPERLKKGILDTVINTDQEDTVKDLLKLDSLTPETRADLESRLADGQFRIEEQIENTEITKELSDWLDVEVKAAIADGRLSSPDDDPFYQKIVKKFDERNFNLTK